MEVISCLEAKPINDPFVIAQRNEIDFAVCYERENAVRWRDLLKKNQNDTKTLRRLLLGAGTQFMQQMGGINICSYYLPTVLVNAVGLEETMARLLTACNAISYLIFSGLAVLLVERMGRRGLMMLSTFGQGLCFLIITILLSFSQNGINPKAFGSASVAFFFLVSTSFKISGNCRPRWHTDTLQFHASFGIGMLGERTTSALTPLQRRTDLANQVSRGCIPPRSTPFQCGPRARQSQLRQTGLPTLSSWRSPP